MAKKKMKRLRSKKKNATVAEVKDVILEIEEYKKEKKKVGRSQDGAGLYYHILQHCPAGLTAK